MPRSDTYEEFWSGNDQRLRNALSRYGAEPVSINDVVQHYLDDELTDAEIGTILRCEEWIESTAQWGVFNSSPQTNRTGTRRRWETPFAKIDTLELSYDDNPYKEYVGLEIEVNDQHVKMHLKPSDIPNWDCVHDGSLECGSEFRLRNVFRGDDILREIETLCVALHKRNYRMDPSCSVHVHIDAENMKLGQVKTLIHLHRRYERYLYAMLTTNRATNRFCAKMGHSVFPDAVAFEPLEDAMKETNLYGFKREYYSGNVQDLEHHKYYDGRYSGLNIHSLFLNGTVELRHLEGTLDAKKINAWLLINLALLSIAKKGLTRKQTRALNYTNTPPIREFINLLPDEIQIVFEKYYAKQLSKTVEENSL